MRVVRSRALLLLLPLLVPASFGCGPGAVASAVRPADPTYAGAVGGAGECKALDLAQDALVVDLRPEQRSDLEVAMHEGVAVVAYDCKELRLLKDCRVDGVYNFVGTSTKEQTISLDDSDEIKANLPFSGATLAGKVEGELKRGAKLDIALAMVGGSRTNWVSISKDDLRGRCEGATHFVRGATLGAFAMETSAKADVRAAVEIFGTRTDGASSSARKVMNRDGDITACKSASSDASTAPSRCNALLRLELLAVGAPAPRDGIVADVACPRGLVLAKGKCTLPSDQLPHLCRTGDLRDCTLQCNKGDAKSCTSLGHMHDTGNGAEQSDQKAAKYYKQGCDQKDSSGCVNYAVLLDKGRGGLAESPEKAAALASAACDDGNPNGCSNFGAMLENGRGVEKDSARAVKLFKVGCDAGIGNACFNAGLAAQKGFVGAPDPIRAASFYERACQGGEFRACSNLGVLYQEGGQGLTKDYAHAMRLYRRACASNDGRASAAGCTNVGELYRDGLGVPKDLEKAREHYQRGCTGGQKEACAELQKLEKR